ncbi:Bet v I domain [Macleaya cordata]|uniref:Bet v I domain n=1 Tax=Macleaya cordata TaxID=56857 RepID=A0A200R0N5_MACCD|nr:Bet v I domain [Macleaya cordata]
MGSTGKIEVEVEIKSPASKFWESIRDSTNLFPKIFPEQYKSIEVVEGDGKSVGTIKLLKYAEGMPLITFSKEKIEAVDETTKSVSYSIIDGELVNFYKNFKANLNVGTKGEGSLVKWSCEFEKASEEIPDPNIIKDFAVKSFQDLDAYILTKA